MAAVLAALLLRPEPDLYQSELVALTHLRVQQVQRALAQLVRLGIVVAAPRGNRVYYRPNPACAVLPELRALLAKTAGLADVVRQALTPVAGLRWAAIYGSFARAAADANSDVDLLVVGEVGFGDLSAAVLPAEQRLGRAVNVTLYSPGEFRQAVSGGDHFLARVLAEPLIDLVGEEHDARGVGEPA